MKVLPGVSFLIPNFRVVNIFESGIWLSEYHALCYCYVNPLSSHPPSAPSSTSQATGFTQASRLHKQGTGLTGLRNFHTVTVLPL